MASIIINQHFYSKLLLFAPSLNNYFENYEQKKEENNIIFENSNKDDNINLKKENEVLSYYLKCLKSFFEKIHQKEKILLIKKLFLNL